MKIIYPVYKPYLCGNEKKYVNQCIDSTWISSQGEFIGRFEREFANYLGINNALSCSNGTTALHLALLALHLKPGDEVIVPALTYVASANAITYVGATPVFVDSEEDYFQIDASKIEEKITPKTKAILAVHLYGHANDMNKIVEIAKKHNLYLIEDCAEAIGTKYNNQYVGTFGDIATFSFFGNKTITTGEGGMVVTNNNDLADLVYKFKGQGVSKTHNYFHDVVGYNYRMTNICCALGLAQLEYIDKIINKKIDIANRYKELLSENQEITIHAEQPNTINTYWLVSVLVKNAAKRDSLMKYLLAHGIDSRPFFIPMHKLPIYKSGIHLPVAEKLSLQGFNLPSYPDLKEEDLLYIVNKINSFFEISSSENESVKILEAEAI